MSGWKGLRELLFWAALLLGLAFLGPSLLIPPWLERQAQLEYLQKQREYHAALEYRLRATKAQIEDIQKDPAYILWLAERELGGGRPRNDEPLVVDPNLVLEAPTSAAARVEDALPELTAFIQEVLRRHPYAKMFFDARRIPLMAMGAILLLTSILLLGLTDGDVAVRRGRKPKTA